MNMSTVEMLVFGFGSGAIYALSGWLKNTTTETFQWNKFAETTLLGGLVGLIAGASGMTMDKVFLIYGAGLTAIVQNFIKYIGRKNR